MDFIEYSRESVKKNGILLGINGITTGKLNKEEIEPMLTEMQRKHKVKTNLTSLLKRVYMS